MDHPDIPPKNDQPEELARLGGALNALFEGQRISRDRLRRSLAQQTEELEILRAQHAAILHSRGWRFLEFLYSIRLKLMPRGSWRERALYRVYSGLRGSPEGQSAQIAAAPAGHADAVLPSKTDYQAWILANEPEIPELYAQMIQSLTAGPGPLISVITPVYATPIDVLDDTIRSVMQQTYPHWELCIANGSPDIQEITALLAGWTEKDPRIKVITLEKNLGIAGNTNAALELAQGTFVAFLDHDDCLAPDALFEVSKVLSEYPKVDVLYSDEDRISEDGLDRLEPIFKPAYSPDFLRSINYMAHFLVIRRELGSKIGWLREGFEGAQDYDLILRAVEKSRQIAHIPKVLYHWRVIPGSTAHDINSKSYATTAGIKALQDHLLRDSIPGDVVQGFAPTTYRIMNRINDPLLISILIIDDGRPDELHRCIKSIREKSNYACCEILILRSADLPEYLLTGDDNFIDSTNVKIIRYNSLLTRSEINLFAAGQASGEVLLFLNQFMEVIDPDWLEMMLEYAVRPEVGAVGAKVSRPSGTILHAGMVLGPGKRVKNIFRSVPRGSIGYLYRLNLPQNFSAVSGDCLMMRKAVFEEVRGFSQGFEHIFSEIDLFLRLRSLGYLIAWTPYAELITNADSTVTENIDIEKSHLIEHDFDRLAIRWPEIFARCDEYDNPNFRVDKGDYSISAEISDGVVRVTNIVFEPTDMHRRYFTISKP
jgi:GT2 family glycosyltransferase